MTFLTLRIIKLWHPQKIINFLPHHQFAKMKNRCCLKSIELINLWQTARPSHLFSVRMLWLVLQKKQFSKKKVIERLETSLRVKSFVSFCNTFCFSLCFLFVPHKKIYIIKINKMLYMIEAMSFKCLLDVF